MTRAIVKTISPRHGFSFDTVPTIRGSMYGGGDVYPNRCGVSYVGDDYAAVLDSVFEMADAVSCGNGVTPDAAITAVLRDEGWRILPTHRKMLVARLTA